MANIESVKLPNGNEYDIKDAISGYASKVTGATNGNLAGLDASGELTDSGIAGNDVVQKSATSGLLKNDGSVDATAYQPKTLGTSITIDGTSETTVEGALGGLNTYADEIKNNISNRNLLRNPWFTVNQRGFTSDTFSSLTYCVDMWLANKGAAVSSSGFIMTPSGGDASIRQYIESPSSILNKDITLSVMLSDGTILQGTANIGDGTSLITYFNDADNSGVRGVTTWSNDLLTVAVQIATTKTATIRAVKLEVGSTSTLAQDVAPNYTEELLKCQRYFVRMSANAGNQMFAIGYCFSATEARICIPMPVPMRSNNAITVTYSGTINVYNGSDHAVSNISANIPNNEFGLTLTTTGLTTGQSCIVRYGSNSSYIDFSAEL